MGRMLNIRARRIRPARRAHKTPSGFSPPNWELKSESPAPKNRHRNVLMAHQLNRPGQASQAQMDLVNKAPAQVIRG